MRVGIVGFGTEGQSAFEHWLRFGHEVTILDANPDLSIPQNVNAEVGPHYLDHIDEYDLLVRSPGINPDFLQAGKLVTTGTREFFEHCPAPIIGVTGTKGKGTTSTLIAEILKAAGKKVWLGGNIGRPGLDFLDEVQPDDVVVLELSSYQLVDLDRSPHIGVCLMIVPEHVPWHGTMDKYVMAKSSIAKFQRDGDLVVYHASNQYSRQIAELSAGRKRPYLESPGAFVRDGYIVMEGVEVVNITEVGLIGPHNLENICAAVSATWEQMRAQPDVLRRVLQTFKGLPNRIEFIREVAGVRWINDTFSVNPSATSAALKSFNEPKVMIVGGFDRGLDFTEMADDLADANIRAVITIGETGSQIAELLKARGIQQVIPGGTTMPEIVSLAAELARAGDVVVLSPGCASFGLFSDYKDRGRQFVQAVKEL